MASVWGCWHLHAACHAAPVHCPVTLAHRQRGFRSVQRKELPCDRNIQHPPLPGPTCLVLDLLVWRIWSLLSPSAVKRKVSHQRGRMTAMTTHLPHGSGWRSVYAWLHESRRHIYFPLSSFWHVMHISMFKLLVDATWCLHWVKYSNKDSMFSCSLSFSFTYSKVGTSDKTWCTYCMFVCMSLKTPCNVSAPLLVLRARLRWHADTVSSRGKAAWGHRQPQAQGEEVWGPWMGCR